MNQLTDAEAFDFLKSLFPGGLKDPALIGELCPDGWENSPLFACYHPSMEVAYQEHLEFSRNIKSLLSNRKTNPENEEAILPDDPEPTFEEFLAKHPPKETPLSPEAIINEPADLLGHCLWDVFSDNHEVIAADGRIVHLGSFRGSAGTIADFIALGPQPVEGTENRRYSRGYDYLDFYMGTIWLRSRADLTPVYRLIFQRLKAYGADWAYAFPQMRVIDFGQQEAESETSYDPSAAIQREAEQKARAAETEKLRRQIERDTQAAKRRARTGPPPATVSVYQQIFGRFPQGWPPDPYSEESEI